MLKIFVIQCHPRNIFNIELFPNYGIWYITAKGLFYESDEEKESSAALGAAITGKKSMEESSEDADN